MAGFAHSLGHLLKTGFEATATGQRYQQTKNEEAQRTHAQEQADREFADMVQARGGRFVHNGIVQRDHVMPDGTVLQGALLDKAGGEGRQVISHKAADGQKIQWELPTADEQIGYHAGRLATAFKAEEPVRQATAQETATNAGNVKQAEAAGVNRAQNEQRNTQGVALPDYASKIFPDAQGRKFLPSEIGPMLQGGEAAQQTQARVDQAKVGSAMQELSAVPDQAGYDAWRAKYPEVAASAPTVYSKPVVQSMIRRAVPIAEQPKFDIEQFRAQSMNTAQADIEKQVDALDPNHKNPDLVNRTKILVNGWLRQGKPEEAQKAVAEAAQSLTSNEGIIARETDPRVISFRVAAAVATQRALNSAGGAALANVPPHLVPKATEEYGKLGNEYADAQAVSNEMQDFVSLARSGNKVAAAEVPLAGTLQIVTTNGVKRINRTEIDQYQGAGSLFDRISGEVGKLVKGQPIPANILSDIDALNKNLATGAQRRYADKIGVLNQTYGASFQPIQLPSTKTAAPAEAPQVPANVATALKGEDPGIHTLSDGSTWMKNKDGAISKISAH